MLCWPKIVLLFLLFFFVDTLESIESDELVAAASIVRRSGFLLESILHVRSTGNHDIHFIRIDDDKPSVWEWESYSTSDKFKISINKTGNYTIFKTQSTSEKKPIFRIYHNTTLQSFAHDADGVAYLSVTNILDQISNFSLEISGKGMVDARLDVRVLKMHLHGPIRCRLTGTAERVMIDDDANESAAFIDAFDLDIEGAVLKPSNKTRLILGNVDLFIRDNRSGGDIIFSLGKNNTKPMFIYDARNHYRILSENFS